jgi:hypothetical protein
MTHQRLNVTDHTPSAESRLSTMTRAVGIQELQKPRHDGGDARPSPDSFVHSSINRLPFAATAAAAAMQQEKSRSGRSVPLRKRARSRAPSQTRSSNKVSGGQNKFTIQASGKSCRLRAAEP